MSTDELFESYSKRRFNIKTMLIALIALIALVSAGYFVYWMSIPVPPSATDIQAIEIRDNTVRMLQYRTFSGEDFRQQLLGKGRLEKYVKVNDEAFFTFPPAEEAEYSDFLAKNFYDQSRIESAKEVDGVLKLADYKLPVSSYAAHFFRTDLANIRIPPDQTLKFQYSTTIYTISLAEMNELNSDRALYGGSYFSQEPDRSYRPLTIFANHGRMVAKPDEPSLKRLTGALLKDTAPEREARIQRLLDFVSGEIEYSFAEALSPRETLKRPDETLMTRNGDCSNKTILLASLLEQIGEEYILLYCPRHITVAVPQGGFADENKLDFTWNGQPWVVAESTAPGFQIGRTKVNRADILQDVQYVQDPKHVDVIFDANSYEVLKFW